MYTTTIDLAKVAVKYLAAVGKREPGKWIPTHVIGDAIGEPSKDSVRYALVQAQKVMPEIEASRGRGFRYVWPKVSKLRRQSYD